MKGAYVARTLLRGAYMNFLFLGLSSLLLAFVLASTLTWVSGAGALDRLSQKSDLGGLVHFRIPNDLLRLAGEKGRPGDTPASQGDALDLAAILTRIRGVPGVVNVYGQAWGFDRQAGNRDIVFSLYSKALLNRAPMPLSQGSWPDWEARPTPILLDSRVKDRFSVGQTVKLELALGFSDYVYEDEFRVAGFLAKSNSHINLMQGGSDMRSSDYITLAPRDLIAITRLPDELPREAANALSGCGFLEVDDAYSDGQIDRLGLASTTDFSTIRENDREFLRTWLPVQVVRAGTLLLFLLLGIGGLQYALFHGKLRAMGVLRLCGMSRAALMAAWEGLFCLMPTAASALGALASGGIDHLYPRIGIWPLLLPPMLTFLLAQIVMIPFVRTWNRMPPLALWKEVR